MQRALFLSIFLLASTSFAAPIQFTQTGTGAGSLNGVGFAASSFTITAISDTTRRELIVSGFSIDNIAASINIVGIGLCTFTTPTRFFVNQNTRTVGFSRATSQGGDLFNGPTDNAFQSWSMLSSIGPISGTGRFLQWNFSIMTNRGILQFNDATNVPAAFQATLIPAPGTLATFPLIALAATRRRRRFQASL